MHFTRCLTVCIALSFSALMVSPAHSASVSGVHYPDTQQVQNKSLKLNGAGIRYKTIFKVYTAGLYLENQASTEQEVLTQSGPKRFSVTMLRDVDAAELGYLFARGMQHDRAAFSSMIVDVSRMSKMFSDTTVLVAGETFTIDWLPGTGTIFSVKGVQQGKPFANPDFFNAMLRIWIGERPADWQLKDALLGKG